MGEDEACGVRSCFYREGVMAGKDLPPVRSRRVEGVLVASLIAPAGISDVEVERIGRDLSSLVETQGAARVLLDLAGVDVLWAVLIGRILVAWKKVREAGGAFRICGIPAHIMDVFEVVRLDRVFSLYPGRGTDARDVAEIFRDTFPTGPLELAWDGGTVQRVARGIHAEGRYEEMPVLGDALEEAGCTDPEVLGHCRDGGEHGPGCWVLERLGV